MNWCSELHDDDCKKAISYTTTEGDLVSRQARDVIQHMFNHQTHHRGQLTSILCSFGINYGCTDLPIIVPEGSQA